MIFYTGIYTISYELSLNTNCYEESSGSYYMPPRYPSGRVMASSAGGPSPGSYY